MAYVADVAATQETLSPFVADVADVAGQGLGVEKAASAGAAFLSTPRLPCPFRAPSVETLDAT
jgi:hypothetical protein